ncbi:hypothetical protein B0O80DRAFT_458851 [Mortierella sp. GBAus27b]|nr:hypothetical protein BGX31_007711 [Mortierella sp. GBA43]KAI8350004.1 hypothetical protein B0O80DRAFT_458851 [Mortierella sp. GBAus27b]
MTKGQPPAYSKFSAASYLDAPAVCCITLNETDKIRLIGASPELVHHVRQGIATSWGTIQRERDYYGAHEFKLLGTPWYGQGTEAVSARRLITGVLRAMAQQGWNIIQSADVSKKQNDKDSLFFEKAHLPNGLMDVGQVDMFSISFNRSDRIRLIDAPAHIPPLVKHAIQTQWKWGIQQEQLYATAFEFKLSGHPFFADGSEAVYSRMTLAQILANLRGQGYKLYTSVDISMGNEGMDVESWVFRRVGPAWA